MDILSSKADSILTLEFNRPERKNAITIEMYQMLADAINAAQDDSEVRVIIIQGKDTIFTAGNDLEDFIKGASDPRPLEERSVFKFMQALSKATKPVIAAVAGNAVGIGTTLLLHCDMVYLGDNARLAVPFAPLGVCPEFASSLLMPQIAGFPRAAEKLMLGEPFTAQEAFEMGLASKIVPAAEVQAYARAQAAKIVALPPASIRATKRLMKAAQAELIANTMTEENKLFAAMLVGPEAREAFTAFFQKRKPDFSQFD